MLWLGRPLCHQSVSHGCCLLLCITFIVRFLFITAVSLLSLTVDEHVLLPWLIGYERCLYESLASFFVLLHFDIEPSIAFWSLKPYFSRQGLSRVVTTSCFTLQTNVIKEVNFLWPQHCWNSLNYINFWKWPRHMTGWQYSRPNTSPRPLRGDSMEKQDCDVTYKPRCIVNMVTWYPFRSRLQNHRQHHPRSVATVATEEARKRSATQSRTRPLTDSLTHLSTHSFTQTQASYVQGDYAWG
jgi:hypothetical protein